MPTALPLAICWSDFSHHRWKQCVWSLDESNFAPGVGAKNEHIWSMCGCGELPYSTFACMALANA